MDMQAQELEVCYFGPYDPNYPRNSVIIKGLRKNGVKVIEFNVHSFNRLLDYIKLLKKHQALKYDVVILGGRTYFGQPLMPFIRRMTKKPIVFDAFLTLYETQVVDRKLVDRKSVKAKLWYLLDSSALHDADLLLTDTYEHAKYYSGFYDVEFDKFRRVLLGSDDEVFYPRLTKKENDCFIVMFWGGFIPLQGVRYIIKAAKLLENCKDVKFELIGTGQQHNEALELSRSLRLENTTFFSNWVPYSELTNYIANSDICLGIFGETDKARRVIPNKVTEAIAMRKPLITGDSSAIKEAFKDRENCLLVPMSNPEALAEAILKLKNDKKLRDKIAENGYKLFKDNFAPKVIGKDLKSVLVKLSEEFR